MTMNISAANVEGEEPPKGERRGNANVLVSQCSRKRLSQKPSSDPLVDVPRWDVTRAGYARWHQYLQGAPSHDASYREIKGVVDAMIAALSFCARALDQGRRYDYQDDIITAI
jgi:hypothetical protein